MAQDNADKQADDTEMSDENSASQNKESQDSGQEDDSQVSKTDGKTGGILRDVTKLREDRRQLRDENSGLKNELAEIKELLTQNQGGGEKKSSDNADADAMDKRLLELLEQREQQAGLAAKNVEANEIFKGLKWVLEDEKFGDEVQDVMHSKYAHLLNSDPVAAVELAYKRVCSRHQVSEDVIDNSASRASGGPKGPNSAGSSPKADEKAYKQLLAETDMSDPEQRALFKRKLKALEGSS